ncbi:Uncharacterised protein [uncultured archaeon]|nr:Uncharacterised protein [uncultured archaeon]
MGSVSEITIGPGQVNKKTAGIRNIKDKAIQAGFNYPPHAAITPLFFREYLERCGAFDEKNKKPAASVANESFNSHEKDGILYAYHSLPSAWVYIRDDQPWGESMGLGGSEQAMNEKEVIWRVQNVLAGQFSPDVIAFKKLKGLTGDFGILMMPVFADKENESAKRMNEEMPNITVNYLGEHQGKSLIQYCHGFFELGRSHVLYSGAASHPVLAGFGTRASKLVEIGGSCSLEAVNSMVDGKDAWTIVQHFPYQIPDISKPQVSEQSVIHWSSRVIGNAVAVTNGFSEYQQDTALHREEKRNKHFQELSNYNSAHKGYLFIANVGVLGEFKFIPLECYSNASAIFAKVRGHGAGPYNILTHMNGLVRALGIPFVEGYRIMMNDNAVDRMKSAKQLLVYTDEFEKRGFISEEVPSKAKIE